MEEFMCGDIWTYLQDVRPRVYRYWVYRRMFTPAEQDAKYIDESVFEDSLARFGIIRECVELPDKDLLFGFQDVYGDGTLLKTIKNISYYKLSEIRMEYCEDDQRLLDADVFE